MNQRNASMTVIGAGSYGTALAITLARNVPRGCPLGP
ncbi:Glycerol-3-phosphate dehydrogenase [Escherichia coli]|nr:Glycerol-3-phosphate dehydrogenase [Escherichia coli]CAK5455783.1 Glycerol-3-phosphate dehydrogenase [Escherichia coli]